MGGRPCSFSEALREKVPVGFCRALLGLCGRWAASIAERVFELRCLTGFDV